jgi:hypothetical protein
MQAWQLSKRLLKSNVSAVSLPALNDFAGNPLQYLGFSLRG